MRYLYVLVWSLMMGSLAAAWLRFSMKVDWTNTIGIGFVLALVVWMGVFLALPANYGKKNEEAKQRQTPVLPVHPVLDKRISDLNEALRNATDGWTYECRLTARLSNELHRINKAIQRRNRKIKALRDTQPRDPGARHAMRILFPPIKNNESQDALDNLMAVQSDLVANQRDAVTMATLERVINQLAAARALRESHPIAGAA